MALFSGLDAFSDFFTQPLENLLICQTANVHRCEVVLIKPVLQNNFWNSFCCASGAHAPTKTRVVGSSSAERSASSITLLPPNPQSCG